MDFGPSEIRAGGYTLRRYVCVPRAQSRACFEQAQTNFWAPLRGDDRFLSFILSMAFDI